MVAERVNDLWRCLPVEVGVLMLSSMVPPTILKVGTFLYRA